MHEASSELLTHLLFYVMLVVCMQLLSLQYLMVLETMRFFASCVRIYPDDREVIRQVVHALLSSQKEYSTLSAVLEEVNTGVFIPRRKVESLA